MESSIMRNASRFLREQKKKRKWQKVLACLALVVAAGTTIALIMPGQALNNTEKVLDCQIEVHQHTADCYAEDGTTLICGLADYVAHTHNELCYNEEGELICKLPEMPAHQHTADCYAEERVLTCGLEETPEDGEGIPVSGGDQENAAPHVHTDECYTTVSHLICGQLEAVEHVHTDACFKEVTVDGEEEATDETLNDTEVTDVSPGDLVAAARDEWYFCGKKAHTHSEECYDEEGNLVCGLEEHEHTEDCLKEVVYGCGLEEHTHSYVCYDAENNLICGMQEHEHDEECIIRYWCGHVTHTHNDACYAGVDVTSGDSAATLNCGLEEHTHTEECLIAPILERVYEDDSIRVTATYPASAMIPEEAEFRVVNISPETDPEHYAERYDSASEMLGNDNLTGIALLNIGFFLEDGTELVPEESVNITLQFLDENGLVTGDPVLLVHFTETGAETLNCTNVDENGSASFTTDGFSDFMFMGIGDNVGEYNFSTIANGSTFDFEHRKYIDYLGDGSNNPHTGLDENLSSKELEDKYRLYLDIVGRSEPVDVLFVIDRSQSMNADRYDKDIYNLLDNGGKGLINQFLALNEGRAEKDKSWMAAVYFNGEFMSLYAGLGYDDYTYKGRDQSPLSSSEGGVIFPWQNSYTSLGEGAYRAPSNASVAVTNYIAGFFQADVMLKNSPTDHKKIVIFISDGLPTLYYNASALSNVHYNKNGKKLSGWDAVVAYGEAQTAWIKRGSGNDDYVYRRSWWPNNKYGTSPADSPYVYNTLKVFDTFYERNKTNIEFYTVAINMDKDPYTQWSRTYTLDKMTQKYNGSDASTILVGEDAGSELKKKIEQIIFPNNVTITDTLSAYVDFYTAQPDVRVSATPKKGETEIVYWQGSKRSGNVVGEGTEINKQAHVVKEVTVDGKKVSVKFYDDYALSPDYTYTLSFNVEVTEQAFDEYSENGKKGELSGSEYPHTGQNNTDMLKPLNDTSSNKGGFHSNTEAKVEFWAKGKSGFLTYDHPVVQTWKSILQLVKKDNNNPANPIGGVEFRLQHEDGTYVVPEVSGGATTDNYYTTNSSGVIAYYYLKHGQYTLTERVKDGYVGAGETPKTLKFTVTKGRITWDPSSSSFGDGKASLSGPVVIDDGTTLDDNTPLDAHKNNMSQYHNNYLWTFNIINDHEQIPLMVMKVDKAGKELELSGAKFTLSKKQLNGSYTQLSTGTVKEGGYVVWEPCNNSEDDSTMRTFLLGGGYYKLEETEPPENYTLPGGETDREKNTVYFEVKTAANGSLEIVRDEKNGNGDLWYIGEDGSFQNPSANKDGSGKIVSWTVTIKNSSPNIKLNLVKLNTIGKPLADAKFGLYKSGKQLFIGVSEVNNGIGSIKWSDSDATDEYTIDASTGYPTLTASESENDYCLKEEELPAGYKILDGLKEGIHFTVTQGSDGKLFVTNSSVDGKYVLAFNEAEVTLTVTVWNTPEDVAVHILKSGDGKELSDAVFRLEKLSADGSFSKVLESKSNEKGIVDLGKLEFGAHYRLEEIQGPPGYNKFDGMIYFTVIADPKTGYAKVELENGNYDSDVSVTGESGPNAVYEITVVNYLGAVLPETGGNGIYLYMLSGLAVAVLSMIALMYKNKFGRAGH